MLQMECGIKVGVNFLGQKLQTMTESEPIFPVFESNVRLG